MRSMISIITATYNRVNLLERVYASLLRQTNQFFEWIIVDDGSVDKTSELVASWLVNKAIDIKYIYKENGGKHTALNVGIAEASGELVLILDSDDYLSDNAVHVILQEWRVVKHNSEIGGLHFLKAYQATGNCIGRRFLKNREVASSIKVHYKDNVTGDKCKIYRTEILKNNQFPCFDGERVLGEGIVWNRLGRTYKLYNINLIIMFCEYLQDGITFNKKRFSIENIQGSAACANERVYPCFPLLVRFRSMATYISRKIYIDPWYVVISKSNCRWLCVMIFPVGLILHFYLRYRNSRPPRKPA